MGTSKEVHPGLKFPNSDRRLRYGDVEGLENMIGYFSARLTEEQRHTEAVQAQLGAAHREAKALRKRNASLLAENEALHRDVRDGSSVHAPRVEQSVLEEESPVLGDTRGNARVVFNGREVVVDIGPDPEGNLVARFVLADNENAVIEPLVLSNDEVEFVVRLDIHTYRQILDRQQRESSHDSSPSVGGPVSVRGQQAGYPNPTEGEADERWNISAMTVADQEEFARAVDKQRRRAERFRDL